MAKARPLRKAGDKSARETKEGKSPSSGGRIQRDEAGRRQASRVGGLCARQGQPARKTSGQGGWQGGEDGYHPQPSGKSAASARPHCQLHFLSAETPYVDDDPCWPRSAKLPRKHYEKSWSGWELKREVSAFDDGERVILDAHGAESGLIIGKKGATLDALQYIVNRIISKKPNDGPGVVVDAEGYRGRREDSLADLARRLAEKAVKSGRPVPVEPMNPPRSPDRPRHARRARRGHDRVGGRRSFPARGYLPQGRPPRALKSPFGAPSL